MQELPDLSGLSSEAKDALIRLLWENCQAMSQRVEALNQRINALEKRPKKTSQNSSKPLAQGFKPNKPAKKKDSERRAASVGRAGGGRSLYPHPHQTVSAHLQSCPDCQMTIPITSQWLHSRYDKIELPPSVCCSEP